MCQKCPKIWPNSDENDDVCVCVCVCVCEALRERFFKCMEFHALMIFSYIVI